MKLFPQKKKEVEPPSGYPPYWTKHEFGLLSEQLSSQRPILNFTITGISHSLEFGSRLSDIDQTESDFWHRLTLYGQCHLPKSQMECKFYVNPDEVIKREYHGYLTFSSNIRDGESPTRYPMIYARLNVSQMEHLDELRRTIQPGIGPIGSADLSLDLKPVKNIAEWINEFEKNDYSPSVVIRGMSANTWITSRA